MVKTMPQSPIKGPLCCFQIIGKTLPSNIWPKELAIHLNDTAILHKMQSWVVAGVEFTL